MSKANERAYAVIRNLIVRGKLQPGQQVSEEELAASCGVSRTPVREALRRLESEQLVRRSTSQRNFVADWSLDEIEESFVLRGLLESHAAGRAATRISDSSLARLNDIHLKMERAAKKGDIGTDQFLEGNRAFHALIIEEAASQRLARILTGIIEQPVVLRTAKAYRNHDLALSITEHGELIKAFVARDQVWAQSVMTAHIRRAFHSYSLTFQAIHEERAAAE